MVKELGVLTFFLTLSLADLRWNELVEIIQKFNKTDWHISNLSYLYRHSALNSNLAIVARYLQYIVEIFFKVFIIDGPLGKSKYYAIWMEFQMCWSTRIHPFLWVINVPKLSSENIGEYADLLSIGIQHHAESTLNDKFCFNFGSFFTNRWIIAQPLSDNSDSKKKETLLKAKEILNIVSGYTSEYLNSYITLWSFKRRFCWVQMN